MRKPVLALTIGDICGIGPEIIVRAFNQGKIFEFSRPVVIGKAAPLIGAGKLIKCQIEIHRIKDLNDAEFKKGAIDLIEIDSKSAALLAIKSIERAVELAMEKRVDGIVTLPINKKVFEKAGLSFPGHTEFLAHLTGARRFAMVLTGGNIRVILVTRHIPLKYVAKSIKKKEVFKNIILADEGCKLLGIDNPRIAVAGLNPHAGEGGILGDEEKKEIVPALIMAQKRSVDVSGPYPADSLFHRVLRGEFDMVVSMYHDQGLIPLKMNFFEQSVNITLGLPIIRTSPGHGTAYDIAGKGIAKETSLLEAVKTASILVRNAEKIRPAPVKK